MMYPLFIVPLFHHEVSDWANKKQRFLSLLDDKNFYELPNASFVSDRNNHNYTKEFIDIFYDEIVSFLKETDLQEMKHIDVWTVKYTDNGDSHFPHNHGSTGFSGVLYLEYDPEVHQSTKFVSSWNNPVTDMTQLSSIPDARSGVMYFWPSYLLHYTDPLKTNKPRTIVSWDMKVQ